MKSVVILSLWVWGRGCECFLGDTSTLYWLHYNSAHKRTLTRTLSLCEQNPVDTAAHVRDSKVEGSKKQCWLSWSSKHLDGWKTYFFFFRGNGQCVTVSTYINWSSCTAVVCNNWPLLIVFSITCMKSQDTVTSWWCTLWRPGSESYISTHIIDSSTLWITALRHGC